VTRHLVGLETFTWESTRETNHTSVHCVPKVSAIPTTCSHINVMYTATEDDITVLTVGSCLTENMVWSVLFIFTLVQSRTHLETVQKISHRLSNSRHIWWSYTLHMYHVFCSWAAELHNRQCLKVGPSLGICWPTPTSRTSSGTCFLWAKNATGAPLRFCVL